MGLQLQVKTFKPAAAATASVAGAQTLGGAGNMTLEQAQAHEHSDILVEDVGE